MKQLKIILSIVVIVGVSSCNETPSSKSTQAQSGNGLPVKKDSLVTQYTCAMHPHYISTDSDGSCPICGMDLVPVNNSGNSSNSDGVLELSVSAEMIQTMGVRTAITRRIEFSRTLRAFGTVEADERLENVSVSRIEGWVEDLAVNAEGDSVSNGDVLYKVYSPDLISAQGDFLSALASRNTKRIKSVQQRLRSIGMQHQTITQLSKSKQVIDRVPVYAERDGIVTHLSVREGSYVKPGSPMLRLQSYQNVWVIASIPETDLPLIEKGLIATLKFPSAPLAPTQGSVDYIYSTIEPKTRTAKVRIEVDNSERRLLPGAYADISFRFDAKSRLAVPTEALLRDSRGNHVITAQGGGRFSSRGVIAGVSVDGNTEITSGLEEGDVVVTSGQFLLDSEVNLREGLSKLSRESASNSNESMVMTDESLDLTQINMDAETLLQFDHFVDMALYTHQSIVSGKAIEPSFVDPAITLANNIKLRFTNVAFLKMLGGIELALHGTQKNDSLVESLSHLMKELQPWLLQGKPQHYANAGLTLYRDSSSNQLWLQKGGDVANPYNDTASSSYEIFPWPMLSKHSRMGQE